MAAEETFVNVGASLAGATAAQVLRLADGPTVPADLIVDVDEHLRTADPAVFDAGDVANALHPTVRARDGVDRPRRRLTARQTGADPDAGRRRRDRSPRPACPA